MKKVTDKTPKTNFDGFFKVAGEQCNKMDFNSFFIYGAIVLAVGVGFYALLSPAAHNARLSNPGDPKIIVASDGPSLRANVAPTLSSARYYLVINSMSGKITEVVRNPFITAQVTHNADVAYFVAGKGEEAVIAGDIGPHCYQILAQYGIRSYGGYSGKVKDVVALYQDARNSMAPIAIPTQGTVLGFNGATAAGLPTPFCICPRCKWRLYAGPGPVEKIRCPNCGFIGAKAAGGFMPAAFNSVVQDPALDPTMPQAPLTDVAYPCPIGQLGSSTYAQGLGNNQQCLIGQIPAQSNAGAAQPVAWGNNYGSGTGKQRTPNSPYVWQ